MTKTALLLLLSLSGLVPMTGTAEVLPVTMLLSASPSHGLPGLPPSLELQVTNTGGSALTLPGKFALQVSTGDRTFIAAWDNRHYRVRGLAESQTPLLTIAPHSTNTIIFESTLEDPLFFCDERFAEPGTYHLQLVCDSQLDSNRLTDPLVIAPTVGLAAPIVSSLATYVVDTPTGDDAAIWALMRQKGTGVCDPRVLSLQQTMWTMYPNAHYTLHYFDNFGGESDEHYSARIQHAIQDDPASTTRDSARLILVQLQKRKLSAAIDVAHDLTTAKAEAATLRTMLNDLASSVTHPDIATQAAGMLIDVPTDAEMARTIAVLNGGPITPEIDTLAIAPAESWPGDPDAVATVTLVNPADEDATITLSQDPAHTSVTPTLPRQPAGRAIPDSVVIPAGQTSATFPVQRQSDFSMCEGGAEADCVTVITVKATLNDEDATAQITTHSAGTPTIGTGKRITPTESSSGPSSKHGDLKTHH